MDHLAIGRIKKSVIFITDDMFFRRGVAGYRGEAYTISAYNSSLLLTMLMNHVESVFILDIFNFITEVDNDTFRIIKNAALRNSIFFLYSNNYQKLTSDFVTVNAQLIERRQSLVKMLQSVMGGIIHAKGGSDRINPASVHFTKRESQVLNRLIKGDSINMIGLSLGICDKTVLIYKHKALNKLGCRNSRFFYSMLNHFNLTADTHRAF